MRSATSRDGPSGRAESAGQHVIPGLRRRPIRRAIEALLARLGYRIEGIRYTPRQFLDPSLSRLLSFDDAVCRLMIERGPSLTFVQVGAYDGLSTDPLRRYVERFRWAGLLLEPMPRPAAALRALYAENPHIRVVEAAIHAEAGSRTMYSVEGDDLPKWAGGMSSFSRQHLVQHEYALPGISQHITETVVQCLTFEEVLAGFSVQGPDLLQVDAEGFDAQILALFPFDRFKPALVQWESKALTKADQESLMERLSAHGYRFAPSGAEDTLAVLF